MRNDRRCLKPNNADPSKKVLFDIVRTCWTSEEEVVMKLEA